MNCSSCGTKNKKTSDFCAKCGARLDKTIAVATASKGNRRPKWIVIAAGSILVGVGGFFAFNSMFNSNGPSPQETESQSEVFNLDVSSAGDYNLTNSDLWNIDFDVESSPIDYTGYAETEMGIFSRDCKAHSRIEEAFGKGTSLRNSGFQNPATAASRYSVSQQIISFDTEADAKAAFDTIPVENISPTCDYLGSDGTTIHWVNAIPIAEAFGIEGNGRYLPSITEWDVLGASGQAQGAVAVLLRGKVISIITMDAMSLMDGEGTDVGINDLKLIAKNLTLRFFKE